MLFIKPFAFLKIQQLCSGNYFKKQIVFGTKGLNVNNKLKSHKNSPTLFNERYATRKVKQHKNSSSRYVLEQP